MKRILPALLSLLFFINVAVAQRLKIDPALQQVEIEVGELTRHFLVSKQNDKAKSSPVVFAFHGHGGNAFNAARTFRVHQLWPEAVAVYMQGIPTPGALTDPQGKRNGWQHGAGDQNDRDLKFFDAVMAWLKENRDVDESSVFSTGHSNGGGMTYLLWAERGEAIAAVAPSASAARRYVRSLSPKPAMHIAEENDQLVKFAWQAATIEELKRINQCDEQPQTWTEQTKLFPSKADAPLVTYIHAGTHKFPPDAAPAIVKFFREYKTLNDSEEADRTE